MCTFQGSIAHWMRFKLHLTIIHFALKGTESLLLNHPDAATEERTVDSASTPHAHDSFCPLNEQHLQELVVAVNPFENDGNKGKTLYHRVQEFVLHKIVVV